MNHGTKTQAFPDLAANLMREGGLTVETDGHEAQLKRLGFHKRSGTPSDELVVFTLMIWV